MTGRARLRGKALALRQLQNAKRYIQGWSYEQISEADGIDISTVSRDVNKGIEAMQARQRQEIAVQRTLALARYQQWLLDEPGDTVQSRANRMKLQARIDKLMGLDKGFEDAPKVSQDLGELLKAIGDEADAAQSANA